MCVLSRQRKVGSEFADVGKLFQVCGPTTGKARLPTVDSLVGGSVRRLVPTERSDRRLGRSATRVKGPRYPGSRLEILRAYTRVLPKTMQSRLFGGAGRGNCHCLHISGTATTTESCTCSVCGAFDAAFAKLLWPLVNVHRRHHRSVLLFVSVRFWEGRRTLIVDRSVSRRRCPCV